MSWAISAINAAAGAATNQTSLFISTPRKMELDIRGIAGELLRQSVSNGAASRTARSAEASSARLPLDCTILTDREGTDPSRLMVNVTITSLGVWTREDRYRWSSSRAAPCSSPCRRISPELRAERRVVSRC
jgi:hypothetical protein